MKPPFLRTLALAVAWLLAASPACTSEDNAPAPTDGLEATTEVEGCIVRLRFHEHDGYLDFRSSMCPLTFAKRMRVLEEQLDRLFADGKLPSSCKQIFLGRLEFFAPFAKRLALGAALSDDWDRDRGRPRSGTPNDFVIRMANDLEIYEELNELFHARGRKPRLTSVEKVLVFSTKDLPYADWLRVQGVDLEAKLPSDAQIWFDLHMIDHPIDHSTSRNGEQETSP